MTTGKLAIKTALQIQKPASSVFKAIVDPREMKNYFISESNGPLEEGKTIIWKFPEFDEPAPVRVQKIMPDKYISFFWKIGKKELLVEISLLPKENNSTLVTIQEKAMENDEEGIKWLMGNTEGWANFLACLKAWLEYGINLRKGAFDFYRE